MIGYNKPLFILAFDHRASFIKDILGIEGEPDAAQCEEIKEMKLLVYQGLKKGIELGVPKAEAALLCDEQFGSRVLQLARQEGIAFAQTVEKSGQKEFEFQYGEEFGLHLKTFGAAFAKALVRFNPEDSDTEMNQRQLEKLKVLSGFCRENSIQLLVEPLIPATAPQLEAAGGDQHRYDSEIRPGLMVRMVKMFQEAGVEADVWKIEGLEKTEDYEAVTAQAKSGGRDNVSAVILGRAAETSQVEKWLKAAARAKGVTGFAIGRTIFHQELAGLGRGQISREEAVNKIGEKYYNFYQIFKSNQ